MAQKKTTKDELEAAFVPFFRAFEAIILLKDNLSEGLHLDATREELRKVVAKAQGEHKGVVAKLGDTQKTLDAALAELDAVRNEALRCKHESAEGAEKEAKAIIAEAEKEAAAIRAASKQAQEEHDTACAERRKQLAALDKAIATRKAEIEAFSEKLKSLT
jgi:chromosome segregation ATPase